MCGVRAELAVRPVPCPSGGWAPGPCLCPAALPLPSSVLVWREATRPLPGWNLTLEQGRGHRVLVQVRPLEEEVAGSDLVPAA